VVLFERDERRESTEVYKQAVQVDRRVTRCRDGTVQVMVCPEQADRRVRSIKYSI
jgi:hypothetical protein